MIINSKYLAKQTIQNIKYKTGKTRYRKHENNNEGKGNWESVKELPHPPKEIRLKQIYWTIFLHIQEINFSILYNQFQIMEKQDLIPNLS